MKKILLLVSILFITACTTSTPTVSQPTSEAEVPTASQPVTESEIPTDCISWFDGCNNCMVKDGELGGCTRKFCPEEMKENPKCLKFANEEEANSATDYSKLCTDNQGTWLKDFNECEYLSKEVCEQNGGTFSECESACRNDPSAEICTMQCVLVCKF